MRGSVRFARHEIRLWRRRWFGSLVTMCLGPVLYLASIGLGLGRLVEGGGRTAALGGVTYAAFAGTGLMAGSAMQTGAGDMSWPVLGSIKYTRTWLAAVATPLRPADLLGGKVVVLILRLAVSSAVFAGSLAVLGLVPPARALAAVFPAILTGVAIGVCMFAVTVRAKTDFSISAVFRFVVTPIFIASGTFFPVSELPRVARALAVLSPLWHGVELLRLTALGVAPALPVTVHIAVLLGWLAFGLLTSTVLLTRRLQP
ncbi:MAG: ABC transporter permease [Euzebya sp.]